MKRTFGIFLLCVYMVPFAEVHQLLRVPFLVQHFQQHQSDNPGLSFKDFLVIHYVGPVEVTDDFQQDQQLPFRSGESVIVNTFSICSFQQISYSIAQPEESRGEYHAFDDTSKSLFSGFDIFQPPRCA